MLAIIASSLIFMEIKKWTWQTLSQTAMELWNQWELRLLVLFSLVLQFVLLTLGNRRKYTVTSKLALLLWLAYCLADWVAITSMSTLLTEQGDCSTFSSNQGKLLMKFWAPFLVLHLGGVDTITAYALEDNELWLRLLPGLVYQVGIAFYVLLKCQTSSALTYIAIPIFTAGIVKYGERIWSRWSASTEWYRNSILFVPAASPDELFPAFDEDFNTHLEKKEIIPEARYLHEAFLSFKVFKPLFANLTLRFPIEQSNFFDLTPSAPEVFKLVDVELGFVYDTFYTKATIVHSLLGPVLRSICFLSSVTTLVAFSSVTMSKPGYSKVDIAITYLLLIGAVVLEVCAFLLNVSSNWTLLWLTEHKIDFVYREIASPINSKGQPESMAQHNLIGFCLEAKLAMVASVDIVLNACIRLAKYRHTSRKHIDEDLKQLICTQIKQKHERYVASNFDYQFLKDLILAERGENVLRRKIRGHDFLWSIKDVVFDHSLLLWHIATDLCYHQDKEDHEDQDKEDHEDQDKEDHEDHLSSECKMSKALSDYMLYLLVKCSFMMPKGISEVRYRDTCKELVRHFKKLGTSSPSALLRQQHNNLQQDSDRPGLPGKSVLSDGIKLARKLQSSDLDSSSKWKMISEVWVEMLTYAASHCGWKEHAKQLIQGRELLTHVCLLMAHYGLTEQIHIEQHPAPTNVQSDATNFQSDSLPPWRWDNLGKIGDYVV